MRSGWLLLLLVAAFPLGAARADTVSATLRVSATVLPHVRLQQDTAAVDITPADIQRGYRDVSRRYALVTNEPERVLLQLNPRLGLTDGVEIAGLSTPLRLAESPLEISQGFGREFTLTYRLWLKAAAMPGRYALPVQVAAVLR